MVCHGSGEGLRVQTGREAVRDPCGDGRHRVMCKGRVAGGRPSLSALHTPGWAALPTPCCVAASPLYIDLCFTGAADAGFSDLALQPRPDASSRPARTTWRRAP